MPIALVSISASDGSLHALIGYALIFGTVFGYLAWLHVRQRRLRERLESLARMTGRGNP